MKVRIMCRLSAKKIVLEVVQSLRINDEKLELPKENQINEGTNDGLLNDILEELKVEKEDDNDIERRQTLKNAAGALLAKEFKRKIEQKEDINDIKLKMVTLRPLCSKNKKAITKSSKVIRQNCEKLDTEKRLT